MIELHIHWLAGLFTSSLDAYLDQALPWLLPLLPPQWLTTPLIYFAVVIAFIFVLVVFL